MRWLVLAIILAPAALAEEATLTAAVNSPFGFVLSAEQLPADYVDSSSFGVATHSGCVEDPSGLQHLTDRRFHSWRGFLGDVAKDGQHVLPMPAGQSGDLRLGDGEMVFTWYMASSPAPWTTQQAFDATDVPVVVPNVVLDVQMRLGGDLAVGDEYYFGQPIIAEGRTAAATISPALTGHPHVSHIGDHVYKFELPLDVKIRDVPGDVGFHVDVSAWIENPHCASQREYIMPDLLYWVTSPDVRSSLRVDIVDAVTVKLVQPTLADGKIRLATHINSTLGMGDLDIDLVRPFEIRGPTNALSLSPPLVAGPYETIVDDAVVHHHNARYKGMEVVQYWDYEADGAKGQYEVWVTATSKSTGLSDTRFATISIGKAVATCGDGEGAICLSETTDKASPGAAFPLAALIVAALALRRR